MVKEMKQQKSQTTCQRAVGSMRKKEKWYAYNNYRATISYVSRTCTARFGGERQIKKNRCGRQLRGTPTTWTRARVGRVPDRRGGSTSATVFVTTGPVAAAICGCVVGRAGCRFFVLCVLILFKSSSAKRVRR